MIRTIRKSISNNKLWHHYCTYYHTEYHYCIGSSRIFGTMQNRCSSTESAAPAAPASAAETTTASSATPPTAATTTTTTTTGTMSQMGISNKVIQRHGNGDACITLNVGGKEFYTLRSTIFSNTVLAEHVTRAEMNSEIVRHGAVFIDRDPEYFPILLKYLRNRIEYQTMANHTDKVALKKYVKSYVDIPNDPKMLRGLYIEAVYYRMNDLQAIIKESNLMIQMASVLTSSTTGATNPFDWLLKLYTNIRSLLIACSVVGGSYLVFIQNEWNYILQKIGLRKRDRHTKSEIFE